MIPFFLLLYKIKENYREGSIYEITTTVSGSASYTIFISTSDHSAEILNLSTSNNDIIDKITLESNIEFNDTTLEIISIAKYAFSNVQVRYFSYPSSLQQIGSFHGPYSHIENADFAQTKINFLPESAFESMTSLKQAILPNSITELPSAVFKHCVSLETFLFDHEIDLSQATYGFYNCSSLKSLDLSKFTVQFLPDYIFAYCSNLEDLNIIAAPSLGSYVFYQTRIKSALISRITSFTNYSFAGILGNFEITIRDETIPEGLLMDCPDIVMINLEMSVSNIGPYAFKGCTSLSRIFIPRFLSSIGNEAFANTKSLEKFNLEFTRLETIGEKAFYGSGIKEIQLPDTLTTISDFAFQNSDIDTITTPRSLNTLGKCVFTSSKLRIADFSRSTEIDKFSSEMFKDCINLEQIRMPPVQLTFGYSIFENCINLKSIILSDFITINSRTFYNCASLEYAIFPGIKSMTNATGYNFYKCVNLKLIGDISHEEYPDFAVIDLQSSGDFIADHSFAYCEKIQKIILGSQSVIETCAFAYLRTLEIADLSKSNLKSLANSLFLECPKLHTLYLPNKMEKFEECSLANVSSISIYYCGSNDIRMFNSIGTNTQITFYSVETVSMNDIMPITLETCFNVVTPTPTPLPRPTAPDIPEDDYTPPVINKLRTKVPEKVTSASPFSLPKQNYPEFTPQHYVGRVKPIIFTLTTIIIIVLFTLLVFIPLVLICIVNFKKAVIQHTKDQHDEKSLVDNAYFDYHADID